MRPPPLAALTGLSLILAFSAHGAADADFGADAAKRASFKIESRSLASGKKLWSGTGFFVAGHELAVTNNHVATDAAARPGQIELVAIFPDGSESKAKVAMADMAMDLAALEVAPPQPAKGAALAAFPMGKIKLRLSEPALGEKIAGAGYGLGLEFSLAEGRVASVGTPGELWPRYQLSAATDGGVSGGPTLDLQGRAVGANVAGAGRSIALAIPAKAIEEFLAKAEAAKAKGESWSSMPAEKTLALYKSQFTVASNSIFDSLAKNSEISAIGPWKVASPGAASSWQCQDDAFDPKEGMDAKPWMSRHDGFACTRFATPMSMGSLSLGSQWTYSASRFEPRPAKALAAFLSWMSDAPEDIANEIAKNGVCRSVPYKKGAMSGFAKTCVSPVKDILGLWRGSHTLWLTEPGSDAIMMARLEFEGLERASVERSSAWLASSISLEPRP